MPVQVLSDKILGMVSWREDGRELYFLTPDWKVMAVDITTMPTIQAGTPRRLFTLPGPLPGNPKQWKSVTPDGQRFVFVADATGPRADREHVILVTNWLEAGRHQ